MWREKRPCVFSKGLQGKTPHPAAINRLIDSPYVTHLARVRGSWEDWVRGKKHGA